jgi:hypothetical protein
MKQVRKRRLAQRHERGFALLLVFLLASAVALMLYKQMPREAFESERDKEQMLIDRGEQYKRAIYLYYVQNNRQWPSKIEDLESTNNHRYLRHRYNDPFTGKDEWRLVHTNGTFLTDSLVTPPPAQGPGATPGGGTPGNAVAGAAGSTGTTGTGTSGGTLTSSLFTPAPAIGSTTPDPNAPPDVNAQVQRRPSDRTLVQNSNFQNQPGDAAPPGNDPGYQPFNPNAPISLYPANPTGGQNTYNPSALPPISLYPNGYNAPSAPGVNGQPGGLNPGGLNQPGQNQFGIAQPGLNQPALNQPGVPGFTVPGTNAPLTTPGVNPSPYNPFNQPGAPGTVPGVQGTNPSVVGGNLPFPVQQFPPQQNIAQDPNQVNAPGNVPGNVVGFGAAPVGAPGAPGAPGTAPSNQAVNLINQLLTTPRQPPAAISPQSQTGGGLAGVASTYKGTAIKSYADRKKYQEWEFVFQLNPQGTLQAPQGAGPNSPTPGGPGGPAGAAGAQGAGGFGTSGAGFGNTGTGGTTSGNATSGFGTH